MRGTIQGTGHTTLLDRREPAILAAIRSASGMRKIEPGRVAWTGPTRQPHLRLRSGILSKTVETVFEAWLFIGSGKRHLTLCPKGGVKLEILGQELKEALARYGVDVQIAREHAMNGQDNTQGRSTLTPDEGWTYCELIADNVKRVNTLKEQEAELASALDEIRTRKKNLQTEALEVLTQLLGADRLAS